MADETTTESTQESQDSEKSTDWKSEARKWESRAKDNLAAAKANEDAAKRLAEIEESKKTAEQKLMDRIADLEQQLSTTKHEATRARVQASHGISDEDAELFLTAADPDKLNAQAKALAERLKAQEQSESDRKKHGPVVPAQKGGESTTGSDPEREFIRGLLPKN